MAAMLLIGLAACNAIKDGEPTPTVLPTNTLPAPEVYTTRAPDVKVVVQAYLEKWKSEDYPAMYAMLTVSSKAAVSQEDFSKRYADVIEQAFLTGIDYEILSTRVDPQTAEALYRVKLNSAIVGEIQRDVTMPLELEDGQWRVRWSESVIMPELAGGNYLSMDRDSQPRATIYDRHGQPLATGMDAAAIGVYPGYVDLTDKASKGLISLLSTLSGLRSDIIQGRIENAEPGDYLPFGEIPADKDPRRLDVLSGWGAAIVSRYSTRLYYDGSAPHVVGYVSAIQEEEIAEYRRKGYSSNEKAGRKGLELWAEQILRGKRGGKLYVFGPDSKPISELGSAPSEPGQDLYTTLDRDLQAGAEKVLSSFSGAVVVLERDTGRVLAMASSPGFDPNAYDITNYNWQTLINQLVNDPDKPGFNRATQGQYPLGSVFKLVTISAALHSSRYTPLTEYTCGYVFEELQGFPRYDWTYEHFQEDGVTQPSGQLTLSEGLIRSCNPFFWHIGLDLYQVGLTKAVSDMARSFGLGGPTGIVGVEEEAGSIPDPLSEVDAINLAIGQGDTQVTALQVARFVAALGNGGTLYRPQLIENIAAPGSTVTSTFQAEVQGTLPLSQENLQVIHDAMVGVIRSTIPAGTALRPFRGLDIAVAGKTGTATAAVGKSHAWFAGYTFEGRADKPDIAIAVIAENAGEGSEIAAPMFRRMVEWYFYGKPLKLYRWESNFDVTRSPTPYITQTPTSTPEP